MRPYKKDSLAYQSTNSQYAPTIISESVLADEEMALNTADKVPVLIELRFT